MKFQFDAKKSSSNLEKHGIDFESAQALWKANHIVMSAESVYENRYGLTPESWTKKSE